MQIDTNFLHEIKQRLQSQQRELDILRAQVRVLDIFEIALQANPPYPRGAEVDICYRLDNFIAHLDKNFNSEDNKKAGKSSKDSEYVVG